MGKQLFRVAAGASTVAAAGFVARARAKAPARQNKPFARYWEESNIASLGRLIDNREAGGPAPLLMAALGDSAAQGLGASAVENGYVPRLAAALSDMTGREVALINLSQSGAVIPSVIATQLPALRGIVNDLGSMPDVVTCDIGGNDVRYRLGNDVMTQYLTGLVQSLPPGTFLADVPSFGTLGRAARRSVAVSEILADLAAPAGHRIVPLQKFTAGLRLADYLARYHASDFFHPNDRAYEAWAQLWVDAVAPVMDAPTVDVAEVGPYTPWT